MRKNKYFYPILLFLFSGLISLAGAIMKFSGVFGWNFILSIGILSQLAGIIWFIIALFSTKDKSMCKRRA